MLAPDVWRFPDDTQFIELRDIYDGWSVARLPNGRYVNRWEPSNPRYAQVQRWIALTEALEGGASK